MASTSDGRGYWLAGSDGGVFTFGNATFDGSMGGKHLNAPIVAMDAAASGYRLVASDGGVFAFGGASFYGSMGGKHLNAAGCCERYNPNGRGYWLIGSDGGVFAFGDAHYFGSMGGKHLNAPIVGIAVPPMGTATGSSGPMVACSRRRCALLRLDGWQAPERSSRLDRARRVDLRILDGGIRWRCLRVPLLIRRFGRIASAQLLSREWSHPRVVRLLDRRRDRRHLRIRNADFVGAIDGTLPGNAPRRPRSRWSTGCLGRHVPGRPDRSVHYTDPSGLPGAPTSHPGSTSAPDSDACVRCSRPRSENGRSTTEEGCCRRLRRHR